MIIIIITYNLTITWSCLHWQESQYITWSSWFSTGKFVSLYQWPLHKITLFTVARGLYMWLIDFVRKEQLPDLYFNTPFFSVTYAWAFTLCQANANIPLKRQMLCTGMKVNDCIHIVLLPWFTTHALINSSRAREKNPKQIQAVLE